MSYFLIAGDLVPTSSNENSFINGDINLLFGNEIVEVFKNSFLNIINLETPLVNEPSPCIKRGQIHSTNINCINAIKALRINLCLLANNHVMDNGAKGLSSTIEKLKEQDISYIGAGSDITQARIPYSFSLSGKKVTVINLADNEFNQAGINTPGVFVYDPLEAFDYITFCKKQCDHLIIIYHGGIEDYQYPTPHLQRICHKMVDCGADIVICQHSHCIGSYENYRNAFILYGQGNFLFDNDNEELHKSSMILRVEIDNNENKLTICPIPILKKQQYVNKANFDETKKILDEFNRRSVEIKDTNFLYNKFDEFCRTKQRECYNAILCNNIVFRGINKISNGWFYKALFNVKNRMRIVNYLECIALNEILNNVFKKL